MKVLIVDDNPYHRELLQRAFAKMRVPSEGVDSAEEALKLMRLRQDAGDPFGAVITDHQMAYMTGDTFLGIVKAEFPRVRRVLVSAYLHREAPNADAFFAKPLKAEDVERIVGASATA